MAFDKDEIKQLKELFDEQSERFDVKLEGLSSQFDDKLESLSVRLDKKLEKQDDKSSKLISDEHSAISLTLRTAIQGVENELEDIKINISRLTEMETGDIRGAYEDIEFLKRRIKSLESKIALIAKR